MKTLAIDPGDRCAGYAIFADKVLTVCGLVRGEKKIDMITDFGNQIGTLTFDKIVIEKMNPDAVKAQRFNLARDLIDVAFVGGLLVGRASRNPNTEIVEVIPSQWKGQVPREIMDARVVKHLNVFERLAVEKVRPASLAHNARAAVGIGLWSVGRL